MYSLNFVICYTVCSMLNFILKFQVWKFCDSSNHDPDAPTPHNFVCGGLSIWEVMKKHPDFRPRYHGNIHSNKIYKNPHYIEEEPRNPYSDERIEHNTSLIVENNETTSDKNESYVMNSRAPTYKQSLFHPMNISFNETTNLENFTKENEQNKTFKFSRSIHKREAVSERLVDPNFVESQSKDQNHQRPSLVAAHISPRSSSLSGINLNNESNNQKNQDLDDIATERYFIRCLILYIYFIYKNICKTSFFFNFNI